MSRNRMPRLYFSFRSPFSWMTVHRLRQALPDAEEHIRFIPYWDPDERSRASLEAAGGEFHYIQMSRAKHLYILHDTKRLVDRLGLQMTWPVDVDPWWEVPHLAWLAARRLGAGTAFYDAIVAARWQRGEDICQPEAVARIGEEVGINGGVLAAAVHDDDIREEATGCLLAAYEDDVFGIPYFRLGHQRFWGLDRLDDFLHALEAGRPAPSPALVPAGLAERLGSFDTDTAGGCG